MDADINIPDDDCCSCILDEETQDEPKIEVNQDEENKDEQQEQVASSEGEVKQSDKGEDSTADVRKTADEIRENIRKTLTEVCQGIPTESQNDQLVVAQATCESSVNWAELYEYACGIFLVVLESLFACAVVIVSKMAKYGRQHAHASEQRIKEAILKQLEDMFKSLGKMVAQSVCRIGRGGIARKQSYVSQLGKTTSRSISVSQRGVSRYSRPSCCPWV